jgi:hypothetical protein
MTNTTAFYDTVTIMAVKCFMKPVPGTSPIKHFTVVINGFSLKARVFVTGKPFRSSIMFVGEALAWST